MRYHGGGRRGMFAPSVSLRKASRKSTIATRMESFALEYPQFLTPETGRMPDSIGWGVFSEVKQAKSRFRLLDVV